MPPGLILKRFKFLQVALHLPQGYPVLALDHFRLPFQTQMAVAIKPEMGTVSEDVKKYSVEKRGCYMVNDRPLRYFKMYTQRNCQLECLTNITLHVCGCVNFYMPSTSRYDRSITCILSQSAFIWKWFASASSSTKRIVFNFREHILVTVSSVGDAIFCKKIQRISLSAMVKLQNKTQSFE